MIGSQVIRWIDGCDRIAFEIDNTNSVFVNDGDLAVTQKEDVTRVLQNWRNV